ncbi:MAG: hypothetical protein AB1421_09445 [Pseudomonadota bacterium]
MTLAKPRQARKRVLLALSSGKLAREVQQAAVRACVHFRTPVDILLTDVLSPDSRLPAPLMLRLEHSGLDYRFAQTEQNLSRAIRNYLARGRAPSTVIVTESKLLDSVCMEAIQTGQHELVDLSQPFKPVSPDKADNGHSHPSHLLLA